MLRGLWKRPGKKHRCSVDCSTVLDSPPKPHTQNADVGALIIRIGFWGHYTIINHNEEQPIIVY